MIRRPFSFKPEFSLVLKGLSFHNMKHFSYSEFKKEAYYHILTIFVSIVLNTDKINKII